MSIATLKKKTAVQYNNMSVGSKNGGFSLNGTRRNAGYIGRGVLGLSFPRTPMRGNEARGCGGTNGTYPRKPIVSSGFGFPSTNGNTANNKSNVVKKSVLDTNGQLMTQYPWIRRPYPYAVVKPDTNLTQNTQTSYIENLSKNTVCSLNKCNKISECSPFANKCSGLSIDQRPRPFNSVIRIPRGWYSITKTPESMRGSIMNGCSIKGLGAINQGSFIKALAGCCNENSIKPVQTKRSPLPGPSASY